MYLIQDEERKEKDLSIAKTVDNKTKTKGKNNE